MGTAFVSPSINISRPGGLQFPRRRKRVIRNIPSCTLSIPSSKISPQAIDAIRNVYTHSNAVIHSGTCAHHLGKQAALLLHDAREKLAKCLNVPNPSHVIFTSSGYDACNILTRSLSQTLSLDDQILIAGTESDHMILPWYQSAVANNLQLQVADADMSEGGRLGFEHFVEYLSPHTKLVVLQAACPLFGVRNPIEDILDFFRDAGVLTAVDVTHALLWGPIDMTTLPADFILASGAVVGGLPASGFLTGRAKALEALCPPIGGENALVETDHVQRVDIRREMQNWTSLPERLEAGMPSLPAAVGLATAIDERTRIFDEAFEEKVDEMSKQLHEKVRACPGLTVYGDGDGENGFIPVICFNVDGAEAKVIVHQLAENGYQVQLGSFDTRIAHRRQLGTNDSIVVTFDPAVYDIADVNNFVSTLRQIS